MHSLKAIATVALLVAVMIAIVASAYIIYIAMFAIIILALFFGIRKLSIWRSKWN